MHRSLAPNIETGQTFYVCGPVWTTDYDKPARENWHSCTVMRTLEGTDVHFRPDVEPVPVDLGTRALVLAAPGAGKHVEGQLSRMNQEHEPYLQVLCLVTTPDGHSFEAVVSAYQLWNEDPLSEYPPTCEQQGVDPNWVAPEKPEKPETEKDSHLQLCYFWRMIDRTPMEDLVSRLHMCLANRHHPISKDTSREAARTGIKMIRAKRAVMNATPEERAKYRLDE